MRRQLRWLFPLLGLLVVSALWVVNCTGPRLLVSDPRVQAPQQVSGPYHVTAVVHNEGPGHGQAQVTFRLRNTQTGRVYQQTTNVTLESGETIVVGVDITAPPGPYTPSVEAEYPPR